MPDSFRQKVEMWLFVLTFVGVYTSISINVGVGTVLAGVGVMFGLILSAFYYKEIAREIRPVGFLILSALIPTLLGFFGKLPILGGTLSVILYTTSVIFSIGVFMSVRRQSPDVMFKAASLIVLTFIVLGLLEIYTPFREISDAFRQDAFSAGGFVYHSDSRDVAFYGIIRPKVFSQEPSFPAKATAFMVFLVIALARTRKQWLFAWLLTFGVAAIFRSPEFYACIVLFAVLVVTRWLKKIGAVADWAPNLVAIVLFLAIVVASLDAQILASVIGGKRGEAIAGGAENSTISRILLPPQILLTTLHQSWLGTGLGAKMMLQPIVRDAATQYGSYSPEYNNEGEIVWGNGLFEIMIGLGPIFTVLFLYALCNAYRTRYILMPLVAFSVVFLMDAGAPNPRNWFYMAIVIAAIDFGLRDRVVVRPGTMRRRGSGRPDLSRGLELRKTE